LSCIVLVSLCFNFLPTRVYGLTFISILFGHYLLSLFYSHKQIRSLSSTKKFIPPLLVLTITSIAYIQSGYYLIYLIPFIIFHIALSETYMINIWNEGSFDRSRNNLILNSIRFAYNVSIFSYLIYPSTILLISIIVIFLALIYFILKNNLNRNYLWFELIALLFVGLTLFISFKITHQHFVFYHILSWVIFPTIGFASKCHKKLFSFILLTLVSTLLLLMIDLAIDPSTVSLKSYIPLWATLHFMSTFALSRLNPRFMTRFFYN
jgi:hypothetical protein